VASAGEPPSVFPSETSATISFPIWLATTVGTNGILSATAVHYVKVGETAGEGCTGGTLAHPTAEEGNLCVYAGIESVKNAKFIAIERANGEEGAQRTGAQVIFEVNSAEEAAAIKAQGTWAVTG
jgi:hypothetical protein